MRLTFFFYCFSFLLFLTACGDSSSASVSTGISDDPATEKTGKIASQAASAAQDGAKTAAPSQPVRDQHDCDLTGRALEDNQYWIPEEELLLAVVADTAELYDKDYPESHRSFQIYNTKICDLIGNHVMPIDREPDYPYYLYPNTYEPINQVICAQGVGYAYCFDLQRKEMLLPLIPEYRSKRKVSDASSGRPLGLSVWDHYLFGFVEDYGAYGFDLTDKKTAKAFLPVAEFLDRNTGSMCQLFMAEMSPGQFQAAYAYYDEDAGEDAFKIVPLFDKALPINSRLSSSARNNNLLVFKYKDGSSAVGVDMAKGEKVALPSEVASKPVQEIIAWMKSR